MSNKKKINRISLFVLIILSVIIFSIVITSTVSYRSSDSRVSLLLTQTIIEDISIKLDKHDNLLRDYGYRIHEKNEHLYYYFPIGTSVSSIPFIYLERKILNLDMRKISHDGAAQKHISAIVSVLIFILLYLIANVFLTKNTSIIIAFLFWLGSSLSSSLATALWSHTFACLYSLMAIFCTLKLIENKKAYYLLLIPLSLIMAYITRPTLSLLSIFLILYIFCHSKKHAIIISILLSIFLSAFMLFSYLEFNQILPDYYVPKRLANSQTFWIAMFGNLFSPARGLIIYSPFLLIFGLNYKSTFSMFKSNKALLLFVLWIIVHLITISKFPTWFAGHSYGSRFMTDILPAFFLLIVILVSKIDMSKLNNKMFISITVIFSIYVNTYMGLFNEYTQKWNVEPKINQRPSVLFDWQYPQFLHTKKRHEARAIEYGIILEKQST